MQFLAVVIAGEEEAVLVAGEELCGIFRISFQCSQGGACGEVGTQIWVFVEEIVEASFAGYWTAGK